jgi:CubicO group peptidase (beta-lactamase class C family)
LGHVLEGVSGKSYSELVKTYIGEPVGAASYWAEKHFRAPGARVHSTVHDMALFSIGVMNNVYVPDELFYGEMINPQSGRNGIGWGCFDVDTPEVTVFHGGSNGYPQAFLQIKPKKRLSVSILARSRDRFIFELDGLANRLLSILEKKIAAPDSAKVQ